MIRDERQEVEGWASHDSQDYLKGYSIGRSWYIGGQRDREYSFQMRYRYVTEVGTEGSAYKYQLGYIDGWCDEERNVLARISP